MCLYIGGVQPEYCFVAKLMGLTAGEAHNQDFTVLTLPRICLSYWDGNHFVKTNYSLAQFGKYKDTPGCDKTIF